MGLVILKWRLLSRKKVSLMSNHFVDVPEIRNALILGMLNIIKDFKQGEVKVFSLGDRRSVAILRDGLERSMYEVLVFKDLSSDRAMKISKGRACEEVFDIDLEENPGVLSWDYFDDFSKAEKVLNSAVTHIFKK